MIYFLTFIADIEYLDEDEDEEAGLIDGHHANFSLSK